MATVREVTAGSPAASAGLLRGDEILQWGGTLQGASRFQEIAGFIQQHENQTVKVLVRRRNNSNNNNGAQVQQLELRPSVWAGRGLLGCHILPV